MKIATYLIIIITAWNLFADEAEELERARKAYSRYIEYAHPSPVKAKKINELPKFLMDEETIRFNDISTTVNEDEFPNQMQNESSIAVNPTNPLNMIASAVDYRDNSSTWVYVSHDGGETWENINLGKPFTYWRSTNDPSVSFNTDGVAFLNYGGFQTQPNDQGEENGENAVFIARSYDEGKTWEAHIPVIIHLGLQTLDSTFEDKYYIEIDNSLDSPYHGDIYIPWKRVTARDSATQIVLSKSTDNGDTWSLPIGLSHRLPGSSEDTTFGQSFPLATTSPEGKVYVCWNHGIEHGIGFVKSEDGGESWTDPRIIHNYNIFGKTNFLPGQGYRHTVKEKVRAEAYPVMRCNYHDTPGKGNIYLCWAADNPPNVYFSKSTDEGENWSEPIIVHSTVENDQFWPWLDIDPMTGDLAVMYLDSRNDSENLLIDCYVSYSSDMGETWIDRRASSEMSDLRLNPFTANAFAGDYSGIAFYDGVIYPSWVDMRNAEDNIRDSDVFTSIVDIDAPNPVENFDVAIIPDSPTDLQLSWEAPTELAFGQPLSVDDFTYKLYRNGEFLRELNGDDLEYLDDDLEAFQEYEYSIVVHTENDSSIAKMDIAVAGGSERPGMPEIVELIGYNYEETYQKTLKVRIPDKREDKETDLVGLKQLKVDVYYQSEMIDGMIMEISDENKGGVLDISDYLQNLNIENGYYDIEISVVSSVDIYEAESRIANQEFYFGEISKEFEDDFDESKLARYSIQGNWSLTDEFAFSGQYSLTESPNTDYESNRNDTITFFPIVAEPFAIIGAQYRTAAFINVTDDGIVQYSLGDDNWIAVQEHKIVDSEEWQDGVRDQNDWIASGFILNNNSDEYRTFQMRLIFESNSFLNDDGWYIDDLRISSGQASVDEYQHINMSIYPNPVNDVLNINIPGKIPEMIEIMDIFGNSLIVENNNLQQSRFSIDVSRLNSGTYFIRTIVDGKYSVEKFTIIN